MTRLAVVINAGTPHQRALRVIPGDVLGAQMLAARAARDARTRGHRGVQVLVLGQVA